MKREKITFENSKGIRLSGILSLPDHRAPDAFAIFAHCFTCNKNYIIAKYISEALSAENFGVLRLDFTGLGESEGSFSATDFSSNIEDLTDAAAFLSKNYKAPSLLIGHSLGGAASIVAAQKLDSVKALAVIGTPSTLDHVKRLFTDKMEEISANGSATVNVSGRGIEIGKGFVDNLSSHDLKKTLNTLSKPILILHSPIDDVVKIDHATAIFMAARHPKSFVSLDRMNHLINRPEDGQYVGKLIATWSSRYISGSE